MQRHDQRLQIRPGQVLEFVERHRDADAALPGRFPELPEEIAEVVVEQTGIRQAGDRVHADFDIPLEIAALRETPPDPERLQRAERPAPPPAQGLAA